MPWFKRPRPRDFLMWMEAPRLDISMLAIRGHLMVESELRDLVTAHSRNPQHLDDMRLTFHRLMLLARTLSPSIPANEWVWDAVRALNEARNAFAHDLDSDEIPRPLGRVFDLVQAHPHPIAVRLEMWHPPESNYVRASIITIIAYLEEYFPPPSSLTGDVA